VLLFQHPVRKRVSMRGPETIETNRLLLRRPVPTHAEAIFTRYASDPEVTRYLSWPRHGTIEQTKAFLAIAPDLGAERLLAYCHPDNRPSARVLEKCGFMRDHSQPHVIVFPNFGENQSVVCLSCCRKFGRKV
jgi:RimJ/RimL family protein N-acetyltransferase